MRVILISFDGLEDTLVQKYNCQILNQREHGIIDLEPYFQGRKQGVGGREALTPEVYLVFITGKVKHDLKQQKLDIRNGTESTIFSFAKNPIAIDVPAYEGKGQGASFMHHLTGLRMFSRYFKNKISLKRVVQEYYKLADIKASYANLINLVDCDLVCFYFQFTDKLGHIYGCSDGTKKRFDSEKQDMYKKAESLTKQIIDEFDDGKTLIIVFSDHGMTVRGTHSSYGFWSSNKPLDIGKKIKITDWFELIKKWYNA